MFFVAWMKRSGIRGAKPIIELGIPGFRKASSGLRLLDIAVHERTVDIYRHYTLAIAEL